MIRNILPAVAAGSAFLLSLIGAPGQSIAGGEINMLVWEGYADASFIKPFEKATGCKVSATYVGSSDDYAAKLAAGGGIYDLTSAPMDSTGILIDAGFLDQARAVGLAQQRRENTRSKAFLQPQPAGGIRLRVEVDQQHLLALLGQAG
mgnify:CR=1 FL=1